MSKIAFFSLDIHMKVEESLLSYAMFLRARFAQLVGWLSAKMSYHLVF